MKTKNSDLEYIAFNINSVFSLVAIIAIIVRSLKFLCIQYLSLKQIGVLSFNADWLCSLDVRL